MSFWIKRDKSLTSKPEVLQIASRLNIDRWSAAGRCEDVWSWADEHTENGHASGVTKVFIDQLVACDGFADAMVLVGWLHIDSNGVTIPNFDRHNGKSAKKRASDAERQKKSRDKSRKECDKNHVKSVTLSDSDSDSVSDSSIPESARGKSFGALKRALGREISTGDEYKLVQYQNTLPDRITIHGDSIDSWALIERALSEAAAHGNCQSAKGAVAYVKSVVERCIQHECWPGEFPDAKSAPAKTHKIPLGTG